MLIEALNYVRQQTLPIEPGDREERQSNGFSVAEGKYADEPDYRELNHGQPTQA